tara:strand:+ start:13887 stop:14024 length:138 start_codon:yes stop_codon:yes gene_type:complete
VKGLICAHIEVPLAAVYDEHLPLIDDERYIVTQQSSERSDKLRNG